MQNVRLKSTEETVLIGDFHLPNTIEQPTVLIAAAPQPVRVSAKTVDDMRLELATIVIELADVPDYDFVTRIDLRDRQQDLRAEIARRAPEVTSVVTLRHQLAGVQQRIDLRLKDRPNVAVMSDGFGGYEAQQMVRRCDTATGLDAARQHIQTLQRQLAPLPSPMAGRG